MPTLKLTGAIGLFCAVLATACADPSSSLPTSPSAVSLSDSSAQASAVSSSGSSAAIETGSAPELSAALGKPQGNGNGGGNGNGNPNGNGGGSGNGNRPPAVQAPAAPSSKKVELEGLISAIAGNVLTVNSQDVVVPATVVVHHGSHVVDFADLVVGDRVHVRAEWLNDVLTATDVKMQNPGDEEQSGDPTNPPDPTDGTALTVDGLVSLLSLGACPNKTFTVGTQAVQTNVSTVFAGGTCNVINNGGHVVVVGVLQSGVLVASNVQIF
jgi:Domain of unknown function (DUF5666)